MAKSQQVLILEPNNELAFKGPITEYVSANLTLSNPSSRGVYFKVKTTAPKFYCVRPNYGVIQAKDKAQINVMLKQPVESPEILENERNRHKFMIQSAFAQEGDQPLALEQFWKSVDSARIMDSKLSVVFHRPYTMPDDVYKKYSIRSESFIYSPSSQTLGLEMFMHSSDKSKTIAELIFWYWGDKDTIIMKKTVHAFDFDSRRISVSASGKTPINKKFNVLIRVLEERISTDNNSLESYYGNYEGVETVTLTLVSTVGTDNKNTSFVVPKYVLLNASPVFQRMFANEMTEKTTGKVVIEDTNPEEFGDFLKAISPKQEHPNPLNVLELLKLADRYEVKPLLDRCEAHLMNCVEFRLIDMLTCADFYRLNKLKANLLMSIEETGLFKLFQQSKPHLGMLNLLSKMDGR